VDNQDCKSRSAFAEMSGCVRLPSAAAPAYRSNDTKANAITAALKKLRITRCL
jgi:hypothetical protein